MTDEVWDYSKSPWHQSEEVSKRWMACLNRIGAENARARLAQTDAGPRGSIAVGTEPVVTIGFVEEWLAWHDRRKSDRESTFRTNQIFWTRWAAISASCAAGAAVIGWLITLALRPH